MESDTAKKESPPAAALPLIEGSLWKAIWIMSWPLMLTTVAGSITSMVDIQVAGLLGSTAQAAVGLSEQILFLFMIFVLSVGVGTTAIVSRGYGAGDLSDTIDGTAQSISLAVIMGLGLAAVAFAVSQFVLPIFSSSSAMLDLGRLYLSIFASFLLPFSLLSIVNAAFRAIGDAKTPLAVVLVSTGICIAGDYLTVVGNWPVPGLGIRGIAFSALAGNTVATGLALWRLSRSPLKDSFNRLWPLSPAMMRRVVHIGIPSALHRLNWSAAVFALFFILARLSHPVQAIASWTVGIRIESIVFMPLMALSMAVSSIVGQNVGARQIRRAYEAGWRTTWAGVVLMVVLGTALFAGADPLARLMSHDATAIEYTIGYLRINALSEPFLALAMVLSGALQGAGDTRTPMWISVLCNWLVRLPLAWLLALTFGLGANGCWIAMALGVTCFGLLVSWRFASGDWIKVRV